MSEINSEKKDLVTIIQISSKYDMRDKRTTRKLLSYFKENGKMSSSVGTRYVERLSYIVNDVIDNQFKCLVCQNELSVDGILCNSCMNKLSGGKMSFHDHIEEQTESIKEQAETTIKQTEAVKKQEESPKKQSETAKEQYCPCCGQVVPKGTVLKSYKEKSKPKFKWWQIAICAFIVLALIGGLIEAISSSKENNKDEIASKAPDFNTVYDTSDYYDADLISGKDNYSDDGPYNNPSEDDFGTMGNSYTYRDDAILDDPYINEGNREYEQVGLEDIGEYEPSDMITGNFATYQITPETFNEAYKASFKRYVNAMAGKEVSNYTINVVYEKTLDSGAVFYDIMFGDENDGNITFKLNSNGGIDEIMFSSGMNAKTVAFISCPLIMAVDSSLDAVTAADFLTKLVNQFDNDMQTGSVTPLTTGNFEMLYGYYDGVSMISIKPR